MRQSHQNQFTSPRATLERRMDIAAAKHVSGEVIDAFWKKFAEAMRDPESHMALVRMGLARFFPVTETGDERDDSSEGAEETSAAIWAEFSSRFSTGTRRDEERLIEAAAGPAPGAD